MSIDIGNPDQDLIALAEIELGNRIDDDAWTADAPAYWIPHAMGVCVRVEVLGVSYVEEDSLAHVKANVSTWWYDTANLRLYIHMDDGGNPGASGHIIMAYFWECFASELIDSDGSIYRKGVKITPAAWNNKLYLPLLNIENFPPLIYSTGGYHEGGTKQGYGTVRFINKSSDPNDIHGHFDARLSLYVYEGKLIKFKIGKPGDSYADFLSYHPMRTGNILWTEEFVEIETEDLRA